MSEHNRIYQQVIANDATRIAEMYNIDQETAIQIVLYMNAIGDGLSSETMNAALSNRWPEIFDRDKPFSTG